MFLPSTLLILLILKNFVYNKKFSFIQRIVFSFISDNIRNLQISERGLSVERPLLFFLVRHMKSYVVRLEPIRLAYHLLSQDPGVVAGGRQALFSQVLLDSIRIIGVFILLLSFGLLQLYTKKD